MKEVDLKNIEEIEVCEVFNSLQGEYPDVGAPYTFIRFNTCNYSCPWCHKESSPDLLYVLNGTPTHSLESIMGISSDDYYLDTRNRFNMIKETTKIISVRKFYFDAYCEIETVDGRIFQFSYDHMLLSNHGWIKAIDIEPNTTKLISFTHNDLDLGREVLVTRKDIRNALIQLVSLKTSTSSYIYGGLLHHNCDSAHIHNKDTYVKLKLSDIVQMVQHTKGLLFTGGEPGLSIDYMSLVLEYLKKCILTKSNGTLYLNRLAVETNGTNMNETRKLLSKYQRHLAASGISPKIFITWSPKFYNEHVKNESIKNLHKLSNMQDIYIKIVYDMDRKEYIDEFIELLCEHWGNQILTQVSLMPCGKTTDQIMENIHKVADVCKHYGINLSPRLHIALNIP